MLKIPDKYLAHTILSIKSKLLKKALKKMPKKMGIKIPIKIGEKIIKKNATINIYVYILHTYQEISKSFSNHAQFRKNNAMIKVSKRIRL